MVGRPDLLAWRGGWARQEEVNRESGGKRKSGHTNHGNRWLRTALVQAAWAASHSKKTYLAAQYRRLAGRRGKKRAISANSSGIRLEASSISGTK